MDRGAKGESSSGNNNEADYNHAVSAVAAQCQRLNIQPVCPPLVMSTSYVPDAPSDEGIYARTTDIGFSALESQLSALHQCDRTVLFPSGLAALSGTLQTCLRSFQKDVKSTSKRPIILMSHELYWDSVNVIKDIHPEKDVHTMRLHRLEEVEALCKTHADNVAMVFIETCSNPSGLVPDFAELRRVVKQHCPNAWLVADNSWLSAATFNPLYKDYVDLIMDSGSKHVGGGRVIFGYVCGNKPTIEAIAYYARRHGQRISQFDAWLVGDTLQTLPLRVRQAGQVAMQVATGLERLSLPGQRVPALRVLYPCLASHPTRDNASKYFPTSFGPAQMWFFLPFPVSSVRPILESSLGPHIVYATSYGKSHTVINTAPVAGRKTDYDDAETNNTEAPEGTWLRLSIGWTSHSHHVIETVQSLLNKLAECSA